MILRIQYIVFLIKFCAGAGTVAVEALLTVRMIVSRLVLAATDVVFLVAHTVTGCVLAACTLGPPTRRRHCSHSRSPPSVRSQPRRPSAPPSASVAYAPPSPPLHSPVPLPVSPLVFPQCDVGRSCRRWRVPLLRGLLRPFPRLFRLLDLVLSFIFRRRSLGRLVQ